MQLNELNFPLSVKQIQEDGCFEGYGSLFDVTDNQKDVVVKGAFSRCLSDSDKVANIKILWQHKMDEPIGVLTDVYEDNRGLYIKGQLLLDVAKGKEAYSLLKSGAINGLSIGYKVAQADIDPVSGVRILQDIELFEVSLVTFPANEGARVRLVKQDLPQTEREFEQFLREAGYSRSEAKKIVAGGYKSEVVQRDARPSTKQQIECERAIDAAIEVLIC